MRLFNPALAFLTLFLCSCSTWSEITVMRKYELRHSQGVKAVAVQKPRYLAEGFLPSMYENINSSAVDKIKNGNYRTATLMLKELVSMKPDSFEPWNNLGVSLEMEGEGAEALRCFVKSRALTGDERAIYNLENMEMPKKLTRP